LPDCPAIAADLWAQWTEVRSEQQWFRAAGGVTEMFKDLHLIFVRMQERSRSAYLFPVALPLQEGERWRIT
jgi:hypothetical protein